MVTDQAAGLLHEARRLQQEAIAHKQAARRHRLEMERTYHKLDELRKLCEQYGIVLDLGTMAERKGTQSQ